jgi:hypothetical protein
MAPKTQEASKPAANSNALSFDCPRCGGPAPTYGKRARTQAMKPTERRRKCRECFYSFITDLVDGREVAVRDYGPPAPPVVEKGTRKRYADGYERGRPRRCFKLAHHQELVDYRSMGKFDPYYERDERHFKLLRGPDGRPVSRQHADLRPGEISLVLE